tara:strand:- start:511 stop:711 length:201 start_codon:yes stop_codon:yes gene_type:complete
MATKKQIKAARAVFASILGKDEYIELSVYYDLSDVMERIIDTAEQVKFNEENQNIFGKDLVGDWGN